MAAGGRHTLSGCLCRAAGTTMSSTHVSTTMGVYHLAKRTTIVSMGDCWLAACVQSHPRRQQDMHVSSRTD